MKEVKTSLAVTKAHIERLEAQREAIYATADRRLARVKEEIDPYLNRLNYLHEEKLLKAYMREAAKQAKLTKEEN